MSGSLLTPSKTEVTDQNIALNSVERDLPLAVKVGFTGFMALLVPYYWSTYGATNFIYFCDIALFLTLIAVWTQRSLYASMAAVGICAVQVLWQIDFVANLVGWKLTGLTDYMFDPEIPLFARFLSFFHFWLPILVIYLVSRLGYDKRALVAWTTVAWIAILVSYFFLPAPGDVLEFANQPVNVNYVYGVGTEKQTMMPQWMWMTTLMGGLLTVVYWPSHRFLSWLDGRR